MEQSTTISSTTTFTWFDKKCRDLVFSILDKLSYGQLTILENGESFCFPSLKGQGVSVHGQIHIRDLSVYRDFVKGGSIGAAEAFIDGKWDSPDLTSVIRIFAKAQQLTDDLEKQKTWLTFLKNKLLKWKNRNTQSGSKKNILAHYDLGNALYERFLDSEMMYSSAIYGNDDMSLSEAQILKLDTICQRLQLSKDDHLIEIGTGWGGLAIHAAKNYGCKVTTTTISDAQFDYAKKRVESLGLTDQITLLKEDYRNLKGQYDKLVSIEMIEAVGFEFLSGFFEKCSSLLKADGRMLIQAITIADQRLDYYRNNVDFIQKYIFPGGFLPSVSLMTDLVRDKTSMTVRELNDFGIDYARTLADWRTNFLANWDEIAPHGYDETFKRLWLYYLGYCEGAFRERSTSVVHLVADKPS
jgi:cyclopropane-fatty-acyl-phospholipid synthase